MNISEFEKQKGWNCWMWKDHVSSPLGDFRIELQIEDSDKTPPGEEMLARAADLQRYAQDHGESILDLVFGSYLRCLKHTGGEDWLDGCDVPRDLKREAVREYMAGRVLFVRRDFDVEETPYTSFVRVVPQWDEEHALEMEVEDGKIVSVDNASFELKDGVLKLEFDAFA
jgi:hypothetical protein